MMQPGSTPPEDSATANFSALIGGGFYSEESIYFLDGEFSAERDPCTPPDGNPETPILAQNIAWAYICGQDKDSPGGMPVVMTRGETTGEAQRWPGVEGRVGGALGDRIAVGFVDKSSRLIELDRDGAARDGAGRDITSSSDDGQYRYDGDVRILQP